MQKLRGQLDEALVRYFGYPSFRPGQRELIEKLLQGKNVLGLLATGGGKSLIYQLPSLILPFLTLVVTPLISLMVDQVQKLRQQGRRDVAYVNSALNPEEVQQLLREIRSGRYKLLYVSPEKLKHPAVVAALRQRRVSLFAIDEAHCISQWGHDFRTDYLRLPSVVEAVGSPPVLALTATATAEVVEEICRLFHIHRDDLVKQSLNRPNIAYDIQKVDSEQEKREWLLHALAHLGGSGIVYCSTREAVEQVVRLCREAGIDNVHGYHGGMEAMERVLIQEQFLRNQLRLIVATNAFGMGVDKPDIRFVLHYHYPASLEAYVQEVGRIGRDGLPGYAGLVYWPGDTAIHQGLLRAESLSRADVEKFLQVVTGTASRTISFAQLHTELGIGETQMRALFFYAEQAGMVADVVLTKDGYVYHLGTGEQHIAAHRIAEELARVRQAKLEKLQAMEHWLEQTGCLRRAIAAYFGEQADGLTYDMYCCSHCGLDRSYYGRQTGAAARTMSDKEWDLEQVLGRLLGRRSGLESGGSL
ncbi:MAG: RecQ family ATP-dependent DNA helicase [Brevibacillus sp.]|nr:RecQ family ATP-dependent DNA helicase [Brevibacillus sp.]